MHLTSIIKPVYATLALSGVCLGFFAQQTFAQQLPTLPDGISGAPIGNYGSEGIGADTAQYDSSRGIFVVRDAQVICIHKIQVAAQADGLIEQLLADEGDSVNKGDTLLMIDSRVANAQLRVAEKELEAAQKQAENDAEVQYSKAAAEVSKEEYNNERTLYNQSSSTWSALKRKQLEAQRSILGIDVAEVKHEQEILAAEVAEEKLQAAKVDVELYKVIAPYSGVIVSRLRDQGEWIRAGEPVLKVVSLDEMKIQAYVPVKDISVASLQDAPATIRVRINPEREVELKSTVSFVSPEIELGRVRISIKIENEKIGNAWLLRDGMTASLEISPRN